MDYLLAVVLAFGFMAVTLAFMAKNLMENRFTRDFFFALILLTIMAGLVAINSAGSIKTVENWQEYTDPATNVTTHNATMSYSIPSASTDISSAMMIIMVAAFGFMIVLLLFSYVFEIFNWFGNLAMRGGGKRKAAKLREPMG